MKVIQLRATNAIGKTTTVKQFIEKYNLQPFSENIGSETVFLTSNSNKKIIVLGKYGDKWRRLRYF